MVDADVVAEVAGVEELLLFELHAGAAIATNKASTIAMAASRNLAPLYLFFITHSIYLSDFLFYGFIDAVNLRQVT